MHTAKVMTTVITIGVMFPVFLSSMILLLLLFYDFPSGIDHGFLKEKHRIILPHVYNHHIFFLDDYYFSAFLNSRITTIKL